MAIGGASEGDTITMLLNDLIESSVATARARVLCFVAGYRVVTTPCPPRARAITLFKEKIV